MEIRCPICNTDNQIPPPAGPELEVSFNCANCHVAVTVDLPVNPQTEQPPETEDENELYGEPLKRHILKDLDNLPVQPQVVTNVQEVLADPDAGVDDLVTIIESDQSAATDVLKLTNSAYYGFQGSVSSIKQATVLLGFETLGYGFIHIIKHADHSDCRCGINCSFGIFIVETDIAAYNRRIQDFCSIRYSFAAFPESPEHFRIKRIAEIQTIGQAQRLCAHADEISG